MALFFGEQKGDMHMKYTITLGTSETKLQVESDNLSLSDISLMVAHYYGEEWYGCSIVDECGNFICYAVKSYYTECDPNKTVYQWALDDYITSMRCHAGLVNVYEDDGGTTYSTNYNPFTEISK